MLPCWQSFSTSSGRSPPGASRRRRNCTWIEASTSGAAGCSTRPFFGSSWSCLAPSLAATPRSSRAMWRTQAAGTAACCCRSTTLCGPGPHGVSSWRTFPLTLIGIDLMNEASLRAAKETLRAVPCELLAGDIGQPGAICEELRRRGVDCRQVLHVRSFLDHDRPFLPPQRRPEGARARFVRHHFVESAYLDKAGNLLAAEEVYQSLVEHLQRWAEILNGHGLCMLEAMLLDVPTTRRYFEDNVSFHFDIEAALSRQYLVPAVPFCMALAEAGLFSSLQGWRCFPESGEYCRILTQHLRRQPFRVRLADHRDLDTLESLQTPGPLQVSRAQLEQRLRLAPLGALLAEAADGPLAAIYTTRLPEESLARAEIEQVSQGPVLQIIALMAAPEAPGVGALLRDFVLQLAQVEGVETCIGLSRCGSWAGSGLGMEDYIRSTSKRGAL
ncbi:unnamed protein product [Effrenium voratum]|nr:unnamed protein product [Effrenium voratum]